MDSRNAGCNSLMESTGSEHSIFKVIDIPTETLDNIYLNQPFEQWPDIIVMDVEGHEQRVFDGVQGMWAYCGEHEECWRPAIFTEFSPSLMKLRGVCTYYRDLLQKFGYKAFRIEEGKTLNLQAVSLKDLEEIYEILLNDPNELHCNLVFLQL